MRARWRRACCVSDGRSAQFLIECGIDSLSLNPDAVLATTRLALAAEAPTPTPAAEEVVVS